MRQPAMNSSPRSKHRFVPLPFGHSALQSRRDVPKVTQRFNAGSEPSGQHESRRDDRSAGKAQISVVPSGLAPRPPRTPAFKRWAIFEPSLRDAACGTTELNFRRALRLAPLLCLCVLALAARGDLSSPPPTNTSPPELFGWFTNPPGVFASFQAQSVNPTNGVFTVVTNWGFQYYLPESLNHFMWTNFLARTNGRSTRLWSERSHPPGWPTNGAPPILAWNTNSILWGMKGMTGISQCWQGEGYDGQVPITALTRRHGYTRGHGMAAEGVSTNWKGQKVWFATRANRLVEVKVTRAIVSLSRGDYTILSFDRDLPPEIEPLRVTDATEMRKRYPPCYGAPRPICEVEQTGQVNVNMPGFTVPAWKGGDSGSPDLLPLGNELVFYGGRSTASPRPEMQADINKLCALEGLKPQKYQLQWVDLSRFPAYAP